MTIHKQIEFVFLKQRTVVTVSSEPFLSCLEPAASSGFILMFSQRIIFKLKKTYIFLMYTVSCPQAY